MAGGPAPSKIVVIHRGQVVVNQRIGVHHLDGGGGDFGAFIYSAADGLAAPQDKGRTDSLARRFERVHEGLSQVAVDIALPIQQLFQRPVDKPCLFI